MAWTDVDSYQSNWMDFKTYCDKRAKYSECYINSKGWNKLKDYHLNNYLQDMENPFGFLYNIRRQHKDLYYQVKCMPKYYYKYLRKRQQLFDSPSRGMVQFPSWRGFLRRENGQS